MMMTMTEDEIKKAIIEDMERQGIKFIPKEPEIETHYDEPEPVNAHAGLRDPPSEVIKRKPDPSEVMDNRVNKWGLDRDTMNFIVDVFNTGADIVDLLIQNSREERSYKRERLRTRRIR